MTSQSGSMVISILIVTVAIMMAGLATEAVLMRSTISADTAQTSADLSYFSGAIGSMLVRETSCRIALGGPANYGGGAGTQVFDPTLASNNIRILKADGTTLYQGAGGATPPAGAMCPNPAVPDITCTEVFGHPQMIIRSIELRPMQATVAHPTWPLIDGATNTYWASLVITAFKPSSGGNYSGLEGAQIISNDDLKISVQIETAGKTIISCSTLSFQGSDRAPLPICVPGYALYSNGNQVRCARTTCPVNYTPSGYLPSGDLCCKLGGGPCLP